MRYSNEDIKKALKDNDKTEVQKIIQDLMNRAHTNDKMTQAEIKLICSFMEHAVPKDPGFDFNICNYEVCRDYIFRKLYLIYCGNLEGRFPAHNAFGLVPIEQKETEIQKLHEFYIEWTPTVSKFNHKDDLLNNTASETNIELKNLNKLHNSLRWEGPLLEEKRKAIILHSKYIYLIAKEFFEINNSSFVTANFGSNQIEINTYSLIHILFGHYAGAIKQFDTQKSFHLDPTINNKELPFELKGILERLGSNTQISNQSIKFIPCRLNGKIYSMWTQNTIKHERGKGKIEFTRLETFYPTESIEELNKINNEFTEIIIDESLSGFTRKTN